MKNTHEKQSMKTFYHQKRFDSHSTTSRSICEHANDRLSKFLLFFLAAFLLSLMGGACGSSNNMLATATVNTPTYSTGGTTEITVTNTSANPILNPKVTLVSWLGDIATNQSLTLNGSIAPKQSYTFSFTVDNTQTNITTSQNNYQYLITNPTSAQIQVSADNLAAPINPELNVVVPPNPLSLTLWEDILINADLWGDEPEILSAGYGFEGIEGVEQGESFVVAAGGAWETVTTPDPPYSALTTARTQSQVSIAWGYPTYFADAMPICFSWPVLPSTVDRSDFEITLNTGEVTTPYVASISPNLEYNERSCVVVFGEFGNRLSPGTEGAIYPAQVTIVKNLKLVGPAGPVSAVGLTKESTNPYTPHGGPTLIGAKLSVMNTTGEGVGSDNAFSGGYPNDGVSYYGSDAQYRLRIYTTGGFSPDGVAAVLPTDFSTFFKILAVENNVTTELVSTNVPYTFNAGTITIVGLADLGVYNAPINDAYTADSDNYIDIVLKGDGAAMRLITAVQIPTIDPYIPFYNPGGPGNNPTPGVTYTSPGPALSQPVTMAIDDPKTVTYP